LGNPECNSGEKRNKTLQPSLAGLIPLPCGEGAGGEVEKTNQQDKINKTNKLNFPKVQNFGKIKNKKTNIL
jgi:hypothetical protein